MKIAFFEIKEWEKEYLLKALPNQEMVFFNEPLHSHNVELTKGCPIISVFAGSQLTKEVILRLPDVKMISTRSTGFDHIDIAEAAERNVVVSNVPLYGENTVAEHTFALILDLSRNVYKSVRNVKEKGFAVEGLMGFDLKGKTLGIVGTGHIGAHVARIANGFEMTVLAFDVKPDKKLAKKLGFTYVEFEELLKNSDIITLHAPHNTHTHHLINTNNIALIKPGAYLINTARGGLIDTNALVKALNDKTIAGAGLDVLEEEASIKEEIDLLSKQVTENVNMKTILENHVLMERENVIITPHNAFNSREALERILQTTVENIQAFMKNKPTNVVKV